MWGINETEKTRSIEWKAKGRKSNSDLLLVTEHSLPHIDYLCVCTCLCV